MEISGLIRAFSYEKDTENFDLKLLGREIKKKRKELNLTLKDCSSINLSVSYLSKIENNKIVPNLQIAHELIEKFRIDKNIFDDFDLYEKYLNNMFKYMYFFKKDFVVKIFSRVNERIKLNLNLFNYVYWIYSGQYEEIEELYKIIFISKSTLKNLEIEAFIIFTFIFKVKVHEYLDAYKLLSLIESMPIKNLYLKELSEFFSLDLFKNEVFKIHFLPTVLKLLNTASEVNNFLFVEILRAKKILFLAENKLINQAKKEYRKYSRNLFSDNFEYKRRFNYEYYQTIEEPLSNIRILECIHIKMLKGYESIYLLKAHMFYKNYEIVKTLLEQMRTNRNDYDFLDVIYLQYLEMYVFNQREKMKKYLTNICFDTFIVQGDLSSVTFYKKQLEKVLIEDTKYKNFYVLQEKYDKKLTEIRNCYDKNY